ncbi:MAG: hypothetical protein Q7U98_05725 [Methylicorpusculum sp.]|uniref:hypothetical protein n=1 Tax=Methylicorpusculum sp. TaxID=2713644 RepID=UPI002718DD26|nr:hypothetical protein [Methylicorpusculum sp.]MDO8938638.1 hypothetical protein [Methylicorpusculum sp.]MDO9242171.1 hypothetical protein [Methylicorpusculum sp.]MDP2176872.1 hypothetical protein [Methylicorpusculum sp.]MDP2204316.1 hypothetical protein [Methylicorpusculum sp.]MDP3531316.1 hypothetical protein [Methylicorpusculum sp.]
MQRFYSKKKQLLVSLFALTLSATTVLADKPTWKEGGQHQNPKGKSKEDKGNKGNRGNSEGRHEKSPKNADKNKVRTDLYFGDQHRTVVRNYYSGQFRAGHCPPGLAKKNKGCLPPGQAKKWRVGYPLPRNVTFYDLPSDIILGMGPAPSGYRYVRVASDILMISVGTGMVVDAIQDLGGW